MVPYGRFLVSNYALSIPRWEGSGNETTRANIVSYGGPEVHSRFPFLVSTFALICASRFPFVLICTSRFPISHFALICASHFPFVLICASRFHFSFRPHSCLAFPVRPHLCFAFPISHSALIRAPPPRPRGGATLNL